MGVAVRDTAKRRKGIPKHLLTSDVAGLVNNDDLDILVELAGGIKPARGYIETALRHGVLGRDRE